MLVQFVPKLFNKIRLCYDVLVNNQYTPVINMNGVIVDVANKKVIIPDDFHIHTLGNLRFSSDKHIMLNSGDGYDEHIGERWSIWLNGSVDHAGQPLGRNHTYIEDCDHDCGHDHDCLTHHK